MLALKYNSVDVVIVIFDVETLPVNSTCSKGVPSGKTSPDAGEIVTMPVALSTVT